MDGLPASGGRDNRRRRGKAVIAAGWTPYSPELVAALGGDESAALAFSRLHYYSPATDHGWVELSAGELAGDLGWGRPRAWRALRKLVTLGVAEVRDAPTATSRGAYRLNYRALAKRLPQRSELSDDAHAEQERIASIDADMFRSETAGSIDERVHRTCDADAIDSETAPLFRSETANPHADLDLGSKNGHPAAGTEVDVDREKEKSARASSLAPVARANGNEGGPALHPASVLAEWNAATGGSFRAPGFVASIAERMAEHPELALEDYRRVAERVTQWAGDKPSPTAAFKSPEQFERCLEESRAGSGRPGDAAYGRAGEHKCRKCSTSIDAEQAVKQHGRCDQCYEEWESAVTGGPW